MCYPSSTCLPLTPTTAPRTRAALWPQPRSSAGPSPVPRQSSTPSHGDQKRRVPFCTSLSCPSSRASTYPWQCLTNLGHSFLTCLVVISSLLVIPRLKFSSPGLPGFGQRCFCLTWSGGSHLFLTVLDTQRGSCGPRSLLSTLAVQALPGHRIHPLLLKPCHHCRGFIFQPDNHRPWLPLLYSLHQGNFD